MFCLASESRLTVRTVLEWIESTHGLHFVVEPLRLKVETKSDVRDRRRRLVDINLSEFAAWTNGWIFISEAPPLITALQVEGVLIYLMPGGPDHESNRCLLLKNYWSA